MDNRSVKNNIQNFRKARRLTQEETALRLGISLTAYRDMEKGKTAIINPNIAKLAEILDTSIEELLLGYKPSEHNNGLLENMQQEYGGQITILERRITDLENLVRSHEETIRSKNEIITMLKKSLGEDK
ncbi:MAG: helix-turn-helix transcriptional regulator [Bacteroidales bacterium]|nr:helix-turn-helix transcriptional regulator [Bacteroidales bacterium]